MIVNVPSLLLSPLARQGLMSSGMHCTGIAMLHTVLPEAAYTRPTDGAERLLQAIDLHPSPCSPSCDRNRFEEYKCSSFQCSPCP